ncbi:MAG: hypothetical protein V7K27_12875 [Nostoc sp.]
MHNQQVFIKKLGLKPRASRNALSFVAMSLYPRYKSTDAINRVSTTSDFRLPTSLKVI